MVRKTSPLRAALIEVVVPWAEQKGFVVHKPSLLHRSRSDIGVTEIIEVQWSVKSPYRTCTVNLGLFHPDYGCPPEKINDLAPVHCGRQIRLGHLMSKDPWLRVSTWYRHSSKRDFWQIIPPFGDFWWRYGETRETAYAAVTDMHAHLSSVGMAWFERQRRFDSPEEIFDTRNFEEFERRWPIRIAETSKAAR